MILEHIGSSPPTRGTRALGGGLVCRRRFIPAYAGNTTMTALFEMPLAVHPRLRGEHAWT